MTPVTQFCSVASCALALLVAIDDAAGDIVTSDPSLPPAAAYINPDNDPITYITTMGTATLSNLTLTPQSFSPPFYIGTYEIRNFVAVLTGTLTLNATSSPVSLMGPAIAIAYDKGPSNTTGTFPTEIFQLDLSGTASGIGPVLIRDRNMPLSLGQTTVSAIGGGMYHIDSFFDVFTELSLDNGSTWAPSTGSTFITAVPESRLIWLLAAGLLTSMATVAHRIHARRAVST